MQELLERLHKAEAAPSSHASETLAAFHAALGAHLSELRAEQASADRRTQSRLTELLTAREIVVLGKVRGNVTASNRVDIRSEGSLTGDVTAQRISIEDGAFFKGGIDIRKPGSNEKAAESKSRLRTPAPSVPSATV